MHFLTHVKALKNIDQGHYCQFGGVLVQIKNRDTQSNSSDLTCIKIEFLVIFFYEAHDFIHGTIKVINRRISYQTMFLEDSCFDNSKADRGTVNNIVEDADTSIFQ